VVFWHGLGDSNNTASVARIKRIIQENTLPGTYVLTIRIGDTDVDDIVNSFFKNANEQVDIVCQQIASDPLLQNGYHAMGSSQVLYFEEL
jgi:palmitoyl-protein thioesterase